MVNNIQLIDFYKLKTLYPGIYAPIQQYINPFTRPYRNKKHYKKHHKKRHHNPNWREQNKQQLVVTWILTKKEDLTKFERLHCDITGLFNKLSKSNYNLIKNKFQELDITQPSEMQYLITSLINKGMSEATYAKLYSNLSTTLKYTESNNFIIMLLNDCNKLFTECTSLTRELNFDNGESTFQCRKDVTGFINFIGELYNSNILSHKAIYKYIMTIIDKIGTNTYMVDGICSLMKNILKKYSIRNRRKINKIFHLLKAIEDSETIGIRESIVLGLLADERDDNKW